ncbi:MAG: MFS transporter [Sporichthyaceae bacterium]
MDRPGNYRDALRNREFRGLVIAQVTSEWGDRIARVALASLVLRRTDSALLAVLAFVVSFVPAVFGSAVLGSFADRLPRKVILLGCDLVRFIVMLSLAALAVSSTPIWGLLGVLLIAETFYAPFEVAQRSVIPDVLTDPKDYLAGNSLMRMLYQLDQVIGICLAGLIILAIGERWGLLLNAGTFAISFAVIALTLRWRPAPRDAAERGTSLITDLRAGWRLVFDDPALRALVLLGWGASVFLIAPEAVGLAYARADGASSAVGAALMASLPAGAALGAFIIGRVGPLRQVRAILPLAVLTCLPLLATSVSPPWEVALVLWFLSGLCQGFMVPLMATVSLVSPAKFRGRVIGLAAAGFSAMTAATFLLSGLIADLTSPAVAVTFAGVVGLALVGVAYRSWPARAIQRAATRVYTT